LQRYQDALSALAAGEQGITVEVAYARFRRLRAAVFGVVEDLSDAEYSRLEKMAPGLIMLRQEAVWVEPDPAFFLKLAKTHGRAVDRAFFEAYNHTRSHPAWPVYIHQQTDFSGCTLFGNGELTTTYGIWREFRRKYPDNYPSSVAEILKDVEGNVAGSLCACGDEESVIRELSEFAKRFPDLPVAAAAARRAREVREHRSEFKFHCHAG
jgi:hypothetical protein